MTTTGSVTYRGYSPSFTLEAHEASSSRRIPAQAAPARAATAQPQHLAAMAEARERAKIKVEVSRLGESLADPSLHDEMTNILRLWHASFEQALSIRTDTQMQRDREGDEEIDAFEQELLGLSRAHRQIAQQEYAPVAERTAQLAQELFEDLAAIRGQSHVDFERLQGNIRRLEGEIAAVSTRIDTLSHHLESTGTAITKAEQDNQELQRRIRETEVRSLSETRNGCRLFSSPWSQLRDALLGPTL